jgi:protein-L-isoaspartate O-methyltransferase
MTSFTATYSPDDNKLRLYASARLDAETYARVKAAGFRWAPKQDLFVAPMWTPDREDLLIDLCGDIGDEDTSLADRAEQRADRFEVYQDKRANDADRARKAVDAIADGIPFGQPILVGHHSEKHARKDAQRIENGMRKAVKMWETSQYWKSRAAGALRHAKYKELPTVRARRIKTIEADKRRVERAIAESADKLKLWSVNGLTVEQARKIANYANPGVRKQEEGRFGYWNAYDVLQPDGERYSACPSMTVEQVQAAALRAYSAGTETRQRWIAHYDNRLAYERAMLEEAGASDLLKPKPRRELLPLLNYRAKGGAITAPNMYDRGREMTYPQIEMTKAEYVRINNDYRGTRHGTDKQHRFRTAMVKHSLVSVFLTDSKEHAAPTGTAPETPREPMATRPERIAPAYVPEPPNAFDAMRQTLKAGVKVVTAPQLFPTPSELAARVVELADIQPGHAVLEPSAGTGNLLAALPNVRPGGSVTAVEINQSLADALRETADETRCADFLQCNGDLGTFDRIVMNPPFERGADIEHIKHAATMLKPGGRLVAICANGPRQRFHLKDSGIASQWFDLPDDTFKLAGTGVRTALLVIDAKAV